MQREPVDEVDAPARVSLARRPLLGWMIVATLMGRQCGLHCCSSSQLAGSSAGRAVARALPPEGPLHVSGEMGDGVDDASFTGWSAQNARKLPCRARGFESVTTVCAGGGICQPVRR